MGTDLTSSKGTDLTSSRGTSSNFYQRSCITWLLWCLCLSSNRGLLNMSNNCWKSVLSSLWKASPGNQRTKRQSEMKMLLPMSTRLPNCLFVPRKTVTWPSLWKSLSPMKTEHSDDDFSCQLHEYTLDHTNIILE